MWIQPRPLDLCSAVRGYCIFISGERLQVVSEYKYLGVHLASFLGFKNAYKKVCKKVQLNLIFGLLETLYQMRLQSRALHGPKI